MKIIKTLHFKIAQIASPENVPFTIPSILPQNQKELEEIAKHVWYDMKFKGEGEPSYMYFDYVPEKIRNLDIPQMKVLRYGARKFWNNYLQEMPNHYKYVKQPTKDLLTPQTMFVITKHFIQETLKKIKNKQIYEAGYLLETLPIEIKNKVQDKVAKELTKQNVPIQFVPKIIQKRTKQFKR